MKITFAAMSADDRKSTLDALPDKFKAASAEDLTAAFASINDQGAKIFALDAPTIDQVDEAEALTAARAFALGEIETRANAVKDAEKRFAASKAAFSINDGVEEGEQSTDEGSEDEGSEDGAEDEGSEDGDDAEGEGEGEGEGTEGVEAAKGENPFDKKKKKPMADEEDPEKKVVTASGAQRINPKSGGVARKVGGAVKRPAAKPSSPVVITASADIPGVAMGSRLADLPAVASATISRVGGFPQHSERAAEMNAQSSGGAPVLSKFGVASFGVDFKPEMVAKGDNGNQYGAMQAALKDHEDALVASLAKDLTLTAAGWCAPSEVAYNWLADYVVDGLMTTPQVNAPRGGIMTTTGPALAQGTFAGDAGLDAFGWTHTEAMSEAGTVKTCEVIECPEFEDHRLDVVGYCWKIPILTQNAYPELITDALRLSSVLYAHKMNRRFINDSLALSTAVTASGLGASFTDTLEALAIQATKERRKWNVGKNKVMEVKMPLWVMEVFRADISRRSFTQAPVNDAQIIAEFTSRNLAPEFVNDWAELTGPNPVFPAAFPVMIYPAGTFVKAVKDVINLSAVYDAASLSINEYTGIFFEQGVVLFKAGYGSTKMTIPVCTAGLVGSSILDCHPESANWDGEKQAVVA